MNFPDARQWHEYYGYVKRMKRYMAFKKLYKSRRQMTGRGLPGMFGMMIKIEL